MLTCVKIGLLTMTQVTLTAAAGGMRGVQHLPVCESSDAVNVFLSPFASPPWSCFVYLSASFRFPSVI